MHRIPSRPFPLAYSHVLVAISLIVVQLLGGGPATRAQEDDEARRHGIFIDSLDVSLINVEIYASQDGEPVTDLEAEDFVVLDDGEPVEVTHFFRVAGGRRVEAVASEVATEADVGVEAIELREPSTLVILVDQAFISPAGRKLVFDRLRGQLDRLIGDGTSILVASKYRSVKIVQPLTDDADQVMAVLDGLSEVATFSYASDIRTTVQTIQRGVAASGRQAGPGGGGISSLADSQSELDAYSTFQQAKNLSQQIHGDVIESLTLVRRFLSSLAGLPGRKAVLYVADELPVRAGELAWQVWYEKFGARFGSQFGAPTVDSALNEYDATPQVQRLIAEANAHRVSIYPVGVGSNAMVSLFGAESEGVQRPGRALLQSIESDQALQWLAVGTGGRASIGRGDIEPFVDRLREDLAQYYSLAYASPHRGDGKPHSIEVRVKRPGVELRYLSKYRDSSPEQEMESLALAALVLGRGENPLGVRLEVGEAKKQRDGTYKVPLSVQVPVANLVLLPDARNHRGELSVQLVVRDEKGRFSDPARLSIPIEIPHARLLQALSQSAEYKTELILRGGRQRIAVGVQDELGSVSATLHRDLDVGSEG